VDLYLTLLDTYLADERELAEDMSAEDMSAECVPGPWSVVGAGRYFEYVADQRLVRLDLSRRFGTANPFGFKFQDGSELASFFGRTVSAHQVGVDGTVAFDEEF